MFYLHYLLLHARHNLSGRECVPFKSKAAFTSLNYVSLCTGPVLTCDMQVREIILGERLLNPVRNLDGSLPVASTTHSSENVHTQGTKG